MTKSIGERLLLPLNLSLPGKNVQRDVSYGDHPLMVYDEYPSSDASAPIVLFWYGGSWKTGNKNMYRYVGHRLQAMGAQVYIIDYPKYPDRVYPGFTDDAKAALTQIKKLNPKHQIILMGHSAGANTALLLGLSTPGQVDKVISVAGVCTLRPQYWRNVFGDALAKGLTDPRTYVESGDKHVAFLLIHGLMDRIVSVKDSLSLNQLLQAAGYQSQLIVLKLAEHVLILPMLMCGPLFLTRRRLKQFIFS